MSKYTYFNLSFVFDMLLTNKYLCDIYVAVLNF